MGEGRVCFWSEVCEGGRVQDTVSVQCPFCGQDCEVAIDASVGSQRFTSDCEVCCRPFEVFVECEDGEVVAVEVQAN